VVGSTSGELGGGSSSSFVVGGRRQMKKAVSKYDALVANLEKQKQADYVQVGKVKH
jgi:hypothetical protein